MATTTLLTPFGECLDCRRFTMWHDDAVAFEWFDHEQPTAIPLRRAS